MLIAVTLEDSTQNKVVCLLLALIGKRRRLTAAIMAFLNYFQGGVPHVTQAHGKMERLLRYLQANASLEEKLLFC